MNTGQSSRSYYSQWPLLVLTLCTAAAVLLATTTLTNPPPGCRFVITGSTVEALQCNPAEVAEAVRSFAWSSHDFRDGRLLQQLPKHPNRLAPKHPKCHL
ncbi:TGB3 [Rehmannia allexivirus]